LRDYDGFARRTGTIAYSVLNSHAGLHERWGLTPGDVERLRTVLVTEGNLAASALVPETGRPDLVLAASDVDGAAALASGIGARSIAVRATSAPRPWPVPSRGPVACSRHARRRLAVRVQS
jgi:hypothetical protein